MRTDKTHFAPVAVLSQRQVPDLTFPFTGMAALRQEKNVQGGGPACHPTAYFEDAMHCLAFHDSAIGMCCNRRNIMCEEHAIMVGRSRQNHLIAGSGQPHILEGSPNRFECNSCATHADDPVRTHFEW